MTPHEFIATWKDNALTERAAAQAHFIDLCRLLDHPTPPEADPKGEFFCFEKGASKTGGGDGFADVWKRGFFGWEYKKRRRDLDAAMKQLVDYAAALENPPLHVVCDTIRFRIETRWTNTVTAKHEFEIEDLADPAKLALLRAVFHDPEALRPKVTRAQLTREAADRFQTISDRLQHRNPDREAVAHFVNQLVFCFFANSVGLLPEGLLRKLLDTAQKRPARAKGFFDRLFGEMGEGGEFDLTAIRWFNGGLFDGRPSLALEPDEIGLLIALQSFRWDLIDPTIFGTLFERFLDPDKRAQIGAHYTDPDKIMLIVEPVILRPLRAEWEETKARIAAIMRPLLDEDARGKSLGKRFEAGRAKAEAIRDGFVDRLCAIRILDPACGSGNFLYLALQAVKDLEYRALLECEAMLLGRALPRVGPRILRGLEINPLAAELARTVIWIGDIQWGIRNGITHRPEPILEKLDGIECRDALLSPSPLRDPSAPGEGRVSRPARTEVGSTGPGHPGAPHAEVLGEAEPRSTRVRGASFEGGLRPPPQDEEAGGTASPDAGRLVEAPWPEAEFIVGNPPFLGDRLMIGALGERHSEEIRKAYLHRVPRGADLVCYWFEKARAEAVVRNTVRFGFVATNSIRGGKNRVVLDRIGESLTIFDAWSDQSWTVDGADVRVSLICVSARDVGDKKLDGSQVREIYANLTSGVLDFTTVRRLRENAGQCLHGSKKIGSFDIDGNLARAWLVLPINPNGRSNSDVLTPVWNGADVTRRPGDRWIVDFGMLMTEEEATLFQEPFEYVKRTVLPERLKNRNPDLIRNWWLHGGPRPALRHVIPNLTRVIATPAVSKHRLFCWVSQGILPDAQLMVTLRDDDTTFGVLHSRFHEAWSLRLGTSLEDRPRYTPTTTFETFPFPEGLTPNIPAADYAADPRAIRIAAAARRLDELRRAWLNPPDLVRVEPEVVPGYPDRILPKDIAAAAILKDRTLTKLYNAHPTWLANAHAELDRAVAAAYGWPEEIATEEALARLLALNAERAGAGGTT